MAPSEPVFLATTPSGLWALDSVSRLAHRTVGTLVFLPEETLYLGTSEHYWIGSRRVNGWNPETLLTLSSDRGMRALYSQCHRIPSGSDSCCAKHPRDERIAPE